MWNTKYKIRLHVLFQWSEVVRLEECQDGLQVYCKPVIQTEGQTDRLNSSSSDGGGGAGRKYSSLVLVIIIIIIFDYLFTARICQIEFLRLPDVIYTYRLTAIIIYKWLIGSVCDTCNPFIVPLVL